MYKFYVLKENIIEEEVEFNALTDLEDEVLMEGFEVDDEDGGSIEGFEEVNAIGRGEMDEDLTGAGAGLQLNIPKWTTWAPQISFTLAVGFPEVFDNRAPSDSSSHTLYLGGAVTF